MIVVITGASKGLGKAMAEVFAAAGHQLILCSRSEYALYQAMESLLLKYPAAQIKAKPVDMSSQQEVVHFADWILDEVGVPDILINNAGQFQPGSISNEEEGVLEAMLQVNLMSAYHFTRALLPKMIERQSGHIFNICSIASMQAYPNGGNYSISKYALLGFSKNLREELKSKGIKVTAIMPGAAYTDSWSDSGIDPKRIMEANDVAQMVYAASLLSLQACVEDIVLRPQLGDL